MATAVSIETALNMAVDKAQAQARAAGIPESKIIQDGKMATASLGSVSKTFRVT